MPNSGQYQSFLPGKNIDKRHSSFLSPDDRSGDVYLLDEKLRLAAEVAIVTQRPLLIRGESGSGKSSFAPFVARNLQWRYYEYTVTGRTEARDLLWKFDALGRLRDAQAGEAKENLASKNYIKPGVIWWAFNRVSAESYSPAKEAALFPHNQDRDQQRAVVLIDEIDKADPNVPNDLLDILGLYRFYVDELDCVIERDMSEPEADENHPNSKGGLLLVITTNEERDLPDAFIRRCVVHTMDEPDTSEERIARLKEIANLHMQALLDTHPDDDNLVETVARKCIEMRDASKNKTRKKPSVAEFLDALRICLALGITPDSEHWSQIEQQVLQKK